MKNNIHSLSRKHILQLQPYKSARSIGGKGDVWLNANEVPMSKKFFLHQYVFNRYPEFQSKKLLDYYATYANVKIENILISRGADEAIDLLMKVFCIPNKECIMTFPPTYTMYSKIAEIYNIKNISINMLDNFSLDIQSLKLNLHLVKLIYICRPNNPTGHIFNIKDIIIILEMTVGKSIVVIDEAYIEFCLENTLIFLLSKYSHMVILRTLSKSFGLAGIRCGFAIAHKDIIDLLKKVIAPYPLSSPTIDIAIQALEPSNIACMKQNILQIQKNKIWLLKELKYIHVVQKIFSTSTNYVLVKFFRSDFVFQKLWDQGIIVRNQNHEKTLKGCIRISIGNKTECIKLIIALKNII
ncbi:histidinol-phosphate transaminase [Buchnera aphidicola]|uniref:histidinol-phosphate transaminase n=1 Tax=Buchnera aphidicola TaxID=9 RepID=UPI0034644C85